MTRHRHPLAAAVLAALLVAAPGARADVLVVDSAGGAGVDFTELPAAVTAASDGDVILVRGAGPHDGAVIDGKGLVIAADGPPAGCSGTFLVRNLPAGSPVTLAGLVPHELFPGLQAQLSLEVRNSDAPVLARDCAFYTNGFLVPPVLATGTTTLTLVDCVLENISTSLALPGVSVQGATVFVQGGEITGGPGQQFPPPAGPGGAGAEVTSGLLVVDGAAIHGGPGGRGILTGPDCNDGGTGGPALSLLSATARVVVRDATLVPGAGGLADDPSSCSDGAPGPVTSVAAGLLTTVPDTARALSLPALVREETPVTLTVGAPAGEALLALLSLDTAPVFDQGSKLALHPAAPLQVVFAGLVPASGTILTTAPFLPIGTESVTVHAQGAFVDGGGTLRLGNAIDFVVLESGI